MTVTDAIPAFDLFGETRAFPDVVHCERIRDRARKYGWNISAHRHHHMVQLFQIEAGHSEVQLDEQHFTLTENHFLYVPAQKVHGFVFAADTEGVVLSFPLNVVRSIGPVNSTTAQCLEQALLERTPSRLLDLIRLFAQCYADTGTFRAQISVGLAHAILATVAELGQASLAGPQARHQRRLQKLDALIAEHLANGWGPGDYASALSISTGQLSRVCREASGITTAVYLEESVMTEACRLLAFTRMSIEQIAYRLGYSDPSYFSRRFRKVRLVSPSVYRNHYLESPQTPD